MTNKSVMTFLNVNKYLHIIKVSPAEDDVYGALNTDKQSRPNQTVYRN